MKPSNLAAPVRPDDKRVVSGPHRDKIITLLVKHWFNDLDPDETAFLLEWAKASPERQALFDAATDPDIIHREIGNLYPCLASTPKTRKSDTIGQPAPGTDPGNPA